MEENNLCFIDGQNLYSGTRLEKDSWNINFNKLRKYLFKKYQVKLAYYYLGYSSELNDKLYNRLTDCNFLLIFKDHVYSMHSKKKGNVDSDIIFDAILYKRLTGKYFDYLINIKHIIKK
jgi:hypothetical protein